MQNVEYRDRFGISQSMIKDFIWMGPKQFHETYFNKTEEKAGGRHFDVGSLVDTLAFTRELLDERFVVAECEMPSEAVQAIMKSVYDKVNHHEEEEKALVKELYGESALELGASPDPVSWDLNMLDEDILLAADEYYNEEGKKGWNRTWKTETRIAKLKDQGTEYFNFLKETKGRVVITTEDNLKAIAQVNALKEDPNTRPYFIQQEGEELLHQLEIFTDLETGELDENENPIMVPCKGAQDIVRIIHTTAEIVLADLKTTTAYTAYQHPTSIRKYKYDTQVSFYSRLLEKWIKEERPDLASYKFRLPLNIVIDNRYITPYVYEYSAQDLHIAEYGNSNYLGLTNTPAQYGKLRRGWRYWLGQIAWHLKENKWDRPKELYETGKIKLNMFNY